QELLVNRYRGDMGELPRPSASALTQLGLPSRPNHPQFRYLFFNPDTEQPIPTPSATLMSGRFWNGPYVLHQGARLRNSSSIPPLDLTLKSFDNNGAYGIADTTTTDSSN